MLLILNHETPNPVIFNPVNSVSHASSGAPVAKRVADDEPTTEQVLKKPKTDEDVLPAASADMEVASTEAAQSEPRTGGTFKEAPYTFLAPDNIHLKSCLFVLKSRVTRCNQHLPFLSLFRRQGLEIKPSFPSDRLFVRNPEGDALRGMYFCNPLVKDIITLNAYDRIRLVNCGVKLFMKQPEGGEADAFSFRFVDSGIAVVKAYIGEDRMLRGSLKDLKKLLESYYPLCDGFDQPFKDVINSKSELYNPSSGLVLSC